ncbi:MAG: glycoside hydrolase [Campylobacterales bacterium]|nr:glycoside hydrolase [Campylobacterales bacterium]
MSKVYLSFLWHMHQPYYKDDITGEFKMPWVYLHAIKDYFDMPNYLSSYPNIKATFNLVPSLLIQLKEYESIDVDDKLIKLLKKDVDLLLNDEKEFLINFLFSSNEKNQIARLPYYQYLLNKKSTTLDKSIIDIFNKQELLDLQILFLLSWCGEYLRVNSNVVKSLINQGSNFTHHQKIELLIELSNFIKIIVPYYITLHKSKKIEISATPFYHPIVPILIDINSAIDAGMRCALPKIGTTFKDDASLHIKNAIDYFKNSLDIDIKGFWPSEGSVSFESVSLFKKEGLNWCLSDQDILFKTLKSYDKTNLYKPYSIKTEYGNIHMAFRDKELSDLIGFVYSNWNESDAVVNFISKLQDIYQKYGGDIVIPIILDGENAWEYYRNNAKPFFDELYLKLSKLDWCECVTFSEVFEKLTSVEINSIKSGSWINGDFSIWVGHSEDNLAWELLSLTKKDFEKYKDTVSEDTQIKIEKELMIAEGSDWFWWYGDDHYTYFAKEFDELFRTHLINVYKLLNIQIPKELLIPINSATTLKQFHIRPKNYISPVIDGKRTNIFEWMGAGKIDLNREFSSMDSSSFFVDEIYYGFDKSNIYFSFKGEIKQLIEQSVIEICFENIIYPLKVTKEPSLNGQLMEICSNDYMELKIPILKEMINSEGKIKLYFKLNYQSKIQIMPMYSQIEIDVNGDFSSNWFI